jgi:hypothetical protein
VSAAAAASKPKATGSDEPAAARFNGGQVSDKNIALVHRGLASMTVLTSLQALVTTLETTYGLVKQPVCCIEQATAREILSQDVYQRLLALVKAISHHVLQSSPKNPRAVTVFKLLLGFNNFTTTINRPAEPSENGEILLQLCGDLQVQAKPAEKLGVATLCAGDVYYHLPSSPTSASSVGCDEATSVTVLIYQSLPIVPAESVDETGTFNTSAAVVVLQYANVDSSTPSSNVAPGTIHYNCLVDGVPKILPYPHDSTGLGRIEMDAFNTFVKLGATFGGVRSLGIDRMDTSLASSLNLKWPIWFNEGGRSLRPQAGSRRSEKGCLSLSAWSGQPSATCCETACVDKNEFWPAFSHESNPWATEAGEKLERLPWTPPELRTVWESSLRQKCAAFIGATANEVQLMLVHFISTPAVAGIKYTQDMSKRRGDVTATVLISGSCSIHFSDKRASPSVDILPGCVFIQAFDDLAPTVGWGTMAPSKSSVIGCRFVTFKAFVTSRLKPSMALAGKENATDTLKKRGASRGGSTDDSGASKRPRRSQEVDTGSSSEYAESSTGFKITASSRATAEQLRSTASSKRSSPGHPEDGPPTKKQSTDLFPKPPSTAKVFCRKESNFFVTVR